MVEEKSIHVLYAKITEELPDDIYKKCLRFLPESLRDKHFRYKRWQDRAANLYSKILLIQGLEQFGLDHTALENLRYTEHGRPYLQESVDFNISHSGEYIMCAVATGNRVGIDIEEIKPVDFEDFTELMSKEQWKMIRASDDPLKAFFTLWAIKESVIKADGRGLSIPLNDILIVQDTAFYETSWYLQQLPIDDRYCTSLASEHEKVQLKLKFVDLARL